MDTQQDTDEDDLFIVHKNDDDDNDNESVSSLDVSDHTQTIADALTSAGISTTIVVGGQPKCLFADGTSSVGKGSDVDLATANKPPSGCRGLLAKFNEVDADPSMTNGCRSSSPSSPSKSSACSSSSTSSGTGSSIERDDTHDDWTGIVPCDNDGINLGEEMNSERKVDTAKWKRRVGDKNGKSKKKKKRRRLGL